MHLLLLLSTVLCITSAKTYYIKNDDVEKQMVENCNTSSSPNCIKLNIASWIDQINENENYLVFPGVTIVKENVTTSDTTASIVKELARDFPDDREARLDAFLVKKVYSYLETHSIKLNFLSDDTLSDTGRSSGGGGGAGGGGKNKGLSQLLAAAALVKGVLLFIALKSLAIVAGKALTTSLISLLLSIIVGLITLRRGGLLTYEVVPKPYHTYSQSMSHSAISPEEYGHHSGHTGYGRSVAGQLPLGLSPEYHP